jgi:uncharacterized cupin superfamily protein
MSIEHFKNTAQLALTDPTPVAVPLSEPVAITSGHDIEHADGVVAGIWECTPGRWRRQIAQQEFCHFIAGRCTFTPDGGEPMQIQAGDALLLPANTFGIWDVEETLRKSFVLLK